MFDQIVEQASARFGLAPEKAKQLLGMLVGLIFSPRRGGPAGFIQAFRSQGLGDVLQSWLSGGPKQQISPGELESALGPGALDGMAARLGLPASTVSMAAAGLLPEAVGQLGENGDLPASLPDRSRGWFGNFFDDVGDWGAAAFGATGAALGAGANRIGDLAGDATQAVGAGVNRVGDTAGDATRAAGAGINRAGNAVGDTARAAGGGLGRILPWLLIAALVIAAFLFFKGCRREDATAPSIDTAPASTASAPAEPAARTDSRLAITRTGDKVSYEGVVDSETTRTSVIDALNKAYGAGNVTGTITVDPNAKTPGWLAALAGFLPSFTQEGATLSFEGNRIDLTGGNLGDADRTGLLDKLRGAFGGFTFGGMFERAGQAVERSTEAASEALQNLRPGSFSADDLVKALNLMIIHFDTGSANISDESQDILAKAAEAIKQAPAGTKIEVGGHTDSTGNAAANQKLSEARAAAVVKRLGELGVGAGVLTSKGYGQDKPVADNDTEEGRAQNRRIQFTVVN